MSTEQETFGQIAGGIVAKHLRMRTLADHADLILAIEQALAKERARALRIIREHRESDKCDNNCWTTITKQIRGNSNAN